MPNHKLGSSYSFSQLVKAYDAETPKDDEAHYLLYRGDEILALCLRYKYNPELREVWIGDSEPVAKWGKRLAELKGKKTVPLYYSPRSRTLYEFKGHFAVTDDIVDPAELAKRKKAPVPLSRVVVVAPIVANQPAPS